MARLRKNHFLACALALTVVALLSCRVSLAQNETPATKEAAPGAMAQNVPSANGRLAVSRLLPRVLSGVTQSSRAPAQSIIRSTAPVNAPLTINTKSYPANAFSPLKSSPVWTFDVKASRDGNHHRGITVGHDPFKDGETANIPTLIVPLIIRTHTVATAFDPKTRILTVKPGETTIDPTQADNTCLSAPNNVPLTLTQSSPLFCSCPIRFRRHRRGQDAIYRCFPARQLLESAGIQSQSLICAVRSGPNSGPDPG